MRAAETIAWAGGEHPFRLDIGAMRTIEQSCNAGTAQVMTRLMAQQWYIDDIYTTLRVGLTAGGLPEPIARRLVNSAFDLASPYALAIVALDVLRRFVVWEEADAPQGEAEAGEATS